MANGDAFEDAVRLSRENPNLDVGCHAVLVQGRSVATGKSLPETPRQLVVALARGKIDPYKEIRSQVLKIIDAGLRPIHIDSHKHTHLHPRVFAAIVRVAREFEIPWLRLPFDRTTRLGVSVCAVYRRFARSLKATDYFTGFALTGRLNEETLAAALAGLRDGTTEFMCHPGVLGDELRTAPTRLKESRARELEALTSPRIRTLLEQHGIEVVRFRDLP